MMRSLLREGRPRQAIFLNGVSYERGPRATGTLLEGWERSGEYPVTYVPTVSRPSDPRTRAGPGGPGRVETIVGPVLDELGLSPANTIAYICGNPDMILSAEADAARARLPRGAGQEGALLAEGQGAARGGADCGRGAHRLAPRTRRPIV